MDDKEKWRFDAIAQLYQRSWDQFNERRKVEFRVGLAYWGGLAITVARSRIHKVSLGSNWGLVVCAGAVITLYVFWLKGLWRAQGTDQKIAIHYQKLLQTLSRAEFSEELSDDISQRSGQMGKLSHPTAIFHIGLTALLAIAFVVINWN